MESPSNRMERKSRVTVDAPPISIPGKVSNYTCPSCGRSQTPWVIRTFPEKGFARVGCRACGKALRYTYSTESCPVPKISYDAG